MNISKFDNGQSSLILDRASSQLDEKVHPQSPVFIVGIMERSGTNYLADVPLIDASFAMPTILNEDFVMEHAHLLPRVCRRDVRQMEAVEVDREPRRAHKKTFATTPW